MIRKLFLVTAALGVIGCMHGDETPDAASSPDAAPYSLTLRVSLGAADDGVEMFLDDEPLLAVGGERVSITRGFASVDEAMASGAVLRAVQDGLTVDQESTQAGICFNQCSMGSCTWGQVLEAEVVEFAVIGVSIQSPTELPLCWECFGDGTDGQICP
jgi:hypothetical protein